MHELALCQSIYGIADRAREGRPVTVIHLRVGALRQVVPDTLTYCWGVVTDTTPLDGSVLDVESVPGTLSCRSCGATTVLADRFLIACEDCGGADVEVVHGEELVVTTLDLVEPSSPVRG
ncbi:MAG: hydrogenase maturation nickel metallochaperone HypA [Lapillicoccus sp.]